MNKLAKVLRGLRAKKTGRSNLLGGVSAGLFLLFFTLWGLPLAQAIPPPPVEHFNWDGLEVVWLPDERFPVFQASISFAQGAAAESPAQVGITNFTLNNLDLGTKRFTQKELQHNLEYYGISYGAWAAQETATFYFSGATKFIPQTVQQICHLFTDATFPAAELANEKNKIKTSLRNLASDPESLASRADAIYTAENTGWANLASGRWASIKKWQSNDLKAYLQYLRQQVQKKLYLSGPREVLAMRDHLKACGFQGTKTWQVDPSAMKRETAPATTEIIFLPLTKSNQAKIIFGRVTAPLALDELPAAWLANDFLGGRGMNSQLMKDIRVKYGLTYGIWSSLSLRKNFIWPSIETSARTEKVVEVITRTLQKLKDLEEGIFLPEELALAQTGSARSVIFSLESPEHYLRALINMENLGGDGRTMALLDDRILQVKSAELQTIFGKIYGGPFKIIVVGHPSLKKSLRQQWPLREIKVQDLW